MRVLRGLLIGVTAVLAASAGYSAQEPIYRVGDGVTPPVVEREVKAAYTAAALVDRVEGTVKLECVVRADGTVSEGRVLTPLHPELDHAALMALSLWRFKPGTRDGKPVSVRVEVEMSFSLRAAPQPPEGPLVDSPEVFKPGKDVATPRLVREVKPMYTATAMRAGVQGTIHMSCVVLPDGTVGDVKLRQAVHPDLDESAVSTLRQWLFKPGTKDGVAVPVQVDVEMSFSLRSKK